MNQEEIKKLIESMAPKPGDKNYVGPVGGGMFQIGPGCYTGEEGYKEFLVELDKTLKDLSNKREL